VFQLDWKHLKYAYINGWWTVKCLAKLAVPRHHILDLCQNKDSKIIKLQKLRLVRTLQPVDIGSVTFFLLGILWIINQFSTTLGCGVYRKCILIVQCPVTFKKSSFLGEINSTSHPTFHIQIRNSCSFLPATTYIQGKTRTRVFVGTNYSCTWRKPNLEVKFEDLIAFVLVLLDSFWWLS